MLAYTVGFGGSMIARVYDRVCGIDNDTGLAAASAAQGDAIGVGFEGEMTGARDRRSMHVTHDERRSMRMNNNRTRA